MKAHHQTLEIDHMNTADTDVGLPSSRGDYQSADTYVKVSGPGMASNDRPDTRQFKHSSSGNGGKAHGGARLFFLRVIDSRKWHYSEAAALFLDFFVQMLAASYAPCDSDVKGSSACEFFWLEPAASNSRNISGGFMISYMLDMLIRLLGMRSAIFRSTSNILDILLLLLMGACVGARFAGIYLYQNLQAFEYRIMLVYIVLAALRLIIKPRARTFSKKLHKFRVHGDHIRISIQSLRASLARIPGISALAIETMETDLLIICGRDTGYMSRDELMIFLERALRYRPSNLSATDFLAHLRDIDASATNVAYGVFDVVRSTFWHWRTQKASVALSFFVICVNASISPAMAWFLTVITDSFKRSDKVKVNFGILGTLGLCLPFVFGDFGIGFLQAKIIAKGTELVQGSLLDVILHQDTHFFMERSEGDLNNVFSSDVARVNALWQAIFWNLLNPLVGIIFGFGYAFYVHPAIGLMAFAWAAVVLSSGPQGLAAQRSKEFGSKNAYVAADFQNAIACEKVVRAYEIQEPLMVRFRKVCVQLRKRQFSKDFWASVVQIYIESAMYIFTAMMTAALALKVFREELNQGQFFGFITLLQRASGPVTTLGGFMRVAIGNASSLQRLDDIVLGLGPSGSPDDDKNLPELPKMERELRIEKLVFRYDKNSDNFILNELCCTIPKGSLTCVVGPSGCGKSTLLACLMQFQEADGGAIRLDNHDIFNFSKRSFMHQTAVVFQDGGILNGTIYDNIRYGNMGATDAECEEAARLAECKFITDLKDGYQTVVGQHATCNLSGGQAQRLCLARALCRKPTILLLDEATSALDPETEASIVTTLEGLSKNSKITIISITHRLGTTINADQILVMNKGQVAEQGRYDELVRKGGLFFEMVQKKEERGSGEEVVTEPVLVAGRVRQQSTMRHHQSKHYDDSAHTAESAMALQQFTRNLSSRVTTETELSRGTTGFSRFGNRMSQRSRKTSTDQEHGRRSGNNSNVDTWFPDYHQGRRAANSGASSETSDQERAIVPLPPKTTIEFDL